MLDQRGRPETGPLFVTPSGKGIYELYVYRLVRQLAERAGIPAAHKLSPHSLRHTAITEFLDATNGDLRRAQDFAGHADPRTTRRYDRSRQQLDNHGAYVLAGRYGSRYGSRPVGEQSLRLRKLLCVCGGRSIVEPRWEGRHAAEIVTAVHGGPWIAWCPRTGSGASIKIRLTARLARCEPESPREVASRQPARPPGPRQPP